jgi:ribonuclease P protein component
VLPAPHRLTRGAELRHVARRGVRAGSRTLLVHAILVQAVLDAPDSSAAVPARVGFVVSRAVGGSVQRHRVVRRLRELCRERLGALPPGSRLVVRALAPAADATYQELGSDLDRCLQRVLDRGSGTVS